MNQQVCRKDLITKVWNQLGLTNTGNGDFAELVLTFFGDGGRLWRWGGRWTVDGGRWTAKVMVCSKT
ncbi:MAG: hypothetical protein AAGG75_08755 [Bacteroidota bacterium]